jgi:hypothetical protein
VRDSDGISIRSFRVVFDLERRIHKIDRWRIPVPYGLPLRGIAYWAAAMLVTVVAGRLPLAGELVGVLPAPIRFAIVPVAVAYALVRVQIDGRPAHTALAAWMRFALSPRRVAGLRAVPRVGAVVRLGDIAVLPDQRGARYRPVVIEGPAAVLLRYPSRGWVRARWRRPALHVSQLPGQALFVGKRVRLAAAQRMVVHG